LEWLPHPPSAQFLWNKPRHLALSLHEAQETTMKTTDPKGSQPEALAKLAQVSRHKDGEPLRDGLTANRQTKAIPADPALKQDAATKVLRQGVTHHDEGAKEAIDKLPDRTASR
jgi:hypothetical protein